MAKTDVSQWDSTASNNTDIDSVNIAEGCSPGGINNAIRSIMAQLATAFTGADTGVVTGTAGTDGNLAKWNADGDLVDGAVALSGADATAITGTAGTNGNYAKWNGDGDLVDGDTGSVGAHTIFIPGGSFVATSTDGAEAASEELATNDVMVVGFDFDPDTNEYIQFMMAMPKSWNEGTLTAQIAWKDATTAGTGDVIWGVQMLSLGDSDAMDAAFGTAQTVTDTFITSGDIHITSATSAITASGTPAEGDFLVIQVYRDAVAGGDTYTQDARIFGVKLIMTTNAPNDD